MTKKEKIKQATKTIKKANRKNALKRIWSWFCNVCKKVWNWIKNINIAGLINVALLLVIIILFTGLIFNITKKTNESGVVISKPVETNIVKVVKPQNKNQNVKIQREVVPILPLAVNKKTGIKPQISVVNTEYPVVIHEQSVPAQNLQKKQIFGDTIIESFADSRVLYNGVHIDGNLFIQNMRKYTLPCDAVVHGNMFIRNVHQFKFCGSFKVTGNIYVTKESSFGPIPQNATIGGQIIL